MTDRTDNGTGPKEFSDDDAEVVMTTGRAALRAEMGHRGAIMPTERSRDTRSSVRRLRPVLAAEAPILVVSVLLAVGATVFAVLGPKLLGGATDIIVDGVVSGSIDTGRLNDRLLLLCGIYALAWVLGLSQSYLLTGALQRSMQRLRADAEAKLHRVPLPYVDRQARGDLLSRVTNDIDNLTQSLQQTANQLLTSLLVIIGVTVMMLTVSPLLTLVAYATTPVAILLTRAVATRSKPRFLQQWRSTGELNAQAEETITGLSIVTTFGRRGEAHDLFTAENQQLYESGRQAQFLSGLMSPIMMFVGNIQFVMIAVVGGLRISSGAITIGDMQAMIQYSRQFAMPLQQVASLASSFQSGLASLERIAEFLDAPEIPPDPAPVFGDEPSTGRVVFDDVWFSYDPDSPLITGLDLVAEPGETVAIVGPTGAGKTTLVNLLLRFYDLDAGRILLDGVDTASIGRRELRARIGMVLQDTWLFGDTIWANLRYGNPDATDEQILEAAEVTSVDRFVRTLPDGYDTVIADDASNLSDGEKQLITIARAFLTDPAILVLDEATSSVDTRTEVLIQAAMGRLRAGRTSFVIAHRLSTIRGADTIVVMDGGRIAEQGTHTDLLERGGAYAALHAAQFAGRAT